MTEAKMWHEDDGFWETFASTMFPQKRWDAVPEDVDRIVELLGVEPAAAILDLCCGPGRHALELARRGYRVIGVDRTAAYLERARQQAEAESLNIEFVQDDMRRFCRPNDFDAVINMFTAFGYFEDQDEDRQVVVNIHRALKPGGRLLMEMCGKEVLARIFCERTWNEQEDGSIILEQRKVCRNWSWMENRWILLKGTSREEYSLSHRIYSAAELSGMLAEAGFSSVEIHGDLAGCDYDHKAKRLVAVARK